MNKDLIEEKSKEEIARKCNEIIDKLENFNMMDKYRTIITLYDSFMEICKIEGISFLEIKDTLRLGEKDENK